MPTFTYNFGAGDDVTVTTAALSTPTTSGGNSFGQGYVITSITGTFFGDTITGLYPAGGYNLSSQSPIGANVDNIIFNSNSSGIGQSIDGIDSNGIGFTIALTPAQAATTATGGNVGYVDLYSTTIGGPTGFSVQTTELQPGGAYVASNSALQNATLPTPTFTANVCYCSGTLIRTPRGDVAVEDLQVGDLVVTASGDMRPIVWLGHSKVDCSARANPRDHWPVRIEAGAFGTNKPSRDLYVSPAHSICVDCVDEVMIDAKHLVNGATITREEMAEIDYWHVELETHDVLLANNLPAESYLAMGNREFFVEHEGLDRGSEFGEAEFCRPRGNSGHVLAAVRERLEARAERLGYLRNHDPQLRLLVDGVEAPALLGGGMALFMLPRTARDVRLVASPCVPCDHLGENLDSRRLGVWVNGLSLSDGKRHETIELDDARLDEAFYPLEAEDGRIWRWSKSEAALPSSLWEGFEGAHVALSIAIAASGQRGWIAPPEAAERQAESAPAQRLLYAVS